MENHNQDDKIERIPRFTRIFMSAAVFCARHPRLLSANEKVVLMGICYYFARHDHTHFGRKSGLFYEKAKEGYVVCGTLFQRIADRLGMPRRTFNRAIAGLRSKGVIQVHQRGPLQSSVVTLGWKVRKEIHLFVWNLVKYPGSTVNPEELERPTPAKLDS
jgi:hypothetical protein